MQYILGVDYAYWLLDELAIAQMTNEAVAVETFQRWTLKVDIRRAGILTCEDGNGRKVFSKCIQFAGFPLDETTLYVNNNIILLPTEW